MLRVRVLRDELMDYMVRVYGLTHYRTFKPLYYRSRQHEDDDARKSFAVGYRLESVEAGARVVRKGGQLGDKCLSGDA